ncbi:MAG: DEAD/DEAH box helicase [Desulforhopalus sp.]
MVELNPFNLLHPSVQKWVYKQNWSDLRGIQKDAIPIIMKGMDDVVISATTAAGKTEAAFLPACSVIAEQESGVGVLYVSPLKALINDQFRRLESLCDVIDCPIVPWHGDISQSVKKKCRTNPKGILLITPESLESLLIREAGWLKESFGELKYIIIDEYHSFIGSERGCQLQSLLHRIDHLLEKVNKPVPRIALSATLGDMDRVVNNLRSNSTKPCVLIEGNSISNLNMQIRGYKEIPPPTDKEESLQDSNADKQIASDLFSILRGDSHLIFANSRRKTEQFSAMLADLCEDNFLPNEFFPHHGSLSKESRTHLEKRLQQEHLPTTAVCTMTLELGIDIGKVNSIAQVTAPHSVSSLRQRIGRSGRRGNASTLRMFIAEAQIGKGSNLSDLLRLELLQSVAMVRLLICNQWYEPADINQLHLSTSLHQILAVIAQWGSVRVEQLWSLLNDDGPFKNISIDLYKKLLRQMGQTRLVKQLNDGQLVLDDVGDTLVNHYTFYAVFKTPEDYRIECNGRLLGFLPIDYPVLVNQHIIFSGRRWKVASVDDEKKVIAVKKSTGGKPPKFGGGGMSVHDKVREEMYKVYCEGDHRIPIGNSKIEYLDDTAQELLAEGQEFFNIANFAKTSFLSNKDTVYLIPWKGDKALNTLSTLLISKGFSVTNYAGILEIQASTKDEVLSAFDKFLKNTDLIESQLAELVPDKKTEKFDHFLSEYLLCEGYGAKYFDLDSARRCMKEIIWKE